MQGQTANLGTTLQTNIIVPALHESVRAALKFR